MSDFRLGRSRGPIATVSETLRDAPQLEPFVLPNVTPTGKLLGGGSYGVVQELGVDGLLCAGKKIYDELIDHENEGVQRMIEKYYRECSLLSDLRHPHIVQFLGICFLQNSQLPVLVMELLKGSLDELLESVPNIRLCTKLSILQDVSRGLIYLHSRAPAVIHRDLTARNVLLDAAMRAKIADLGNSRIVHLRPDQLAQTMTKGIPGTLVYMPPEALGSTQRYGTPLDMFSFGHLSLFATIQVFPGDLLTPTYHDPETLQVKARTELQRRERYIATLDEMFGKEHALVVFIKECLAYEPVKRPTARQALERLEAMKAMQQDPFRDTSRLQLETFLEEKEMQMVALTEQISSSEEDMRLLKLQLKTNEAEQAEFEETCKEKDEQLAMRQADSERIPLLQTTIVELQENIRGMEEVCKGKDEVIASVKQEIETQMRALSEAKTRINSLEEELASLKNELIENMQQIHSLNEQIRKLQAEKIQMTVAQEKAMKQIMYEKELLTASRSHDVDAHKLELAAKDSELSVKTSMLSEKNIQLSSLQKQCTSLQTQLDATQQKLRTLQDYDLPAKEEELKQVTSTKELEIVAKEQVLAEKKQELLLMTLLRDQELELHQLELSAKKQDLSTMESLLSEKERAMSSLEMTSSSLQARLDIVQDRVQHLENGEKASTELLAIKDDHISALLMELRGRERMLLSDSKVSKLPSVLNCTLPLRWNKRVKLPMGVVEAQAVEVGGMVYFGGGRVEGNQYKLLIQRGIKGEIETPVMGFAITMINNQLVIVGGRRRDGGLSNQLWLLDRVSETWTQPFPAMLTARWFASAVGYKSLLLVVGGDGEKTIEVLDTKSMRWYTAMQLPSEAMRPSLAVIQDTLHIVWGQTGISVSIPVLFSHALSQNRASKDSCTELTHTWWKTLPDTLSDGPIITSFHGTLISLGAGNAPSSKVAMYVPHTNQWLPVAQLPTPRCGCACVVLSQTEELMVIGGDDDKGKYVKSIDICSTY